MTTGLWSTGISHTFLNCGSRAIRSRPCHGSKAIRVTQTQSVASPHHSAAHYNSSFESSTPLHNGASEQSRAGRRGSIVPRAVQLPQLFPAAGPWGVWSGLIIAGAFGMWSERTKVGKELSGALVATLAGMALANFGYFPIHAAEVNHVFKYILPLAIPMLLYSANVLRILRETGRLLVAFLLGSACTLVGSVLAMALFPLTPLGEEGWKIAAALTARHIGGAVNYMAVSEALGISPSTFGAGLAADDLILTLYFTTLYTLAKTIPPDSQESSKGSPSSTASNAEQGVTSSSSSNGGSSSSSSTSTGHKSKGSSGSSSRSSNGASSSSSSGGGSGGHLSSDGRVISVPEGMAAVALSAAICYLATQLATAWSMPSQSITIITAITVGLATAFPSHLAKLAPSGEGLAAILMQVFFAAVGASANVGLVIKTAPVLFCYSFIALASHLGLLLGIGKLLGFPKKYLLLASNANIGGPSTVAGMAAAKGWRTFLVPCILTSTLGYAIGTFLGIGLGYGVMRKMC